MSPIKLYLVSGLVLGLSWALLSLWSNTVFIVWGMVLLSSYLRFKNNFVSLLLMMEFLVMVAILLSANYVTAYGGFVMLVFILMTLSVGEAVLGLSLLVRLVRKGSKDYLSTKWLW